MATQRKPQRCRSIACKSQATHELTYSYPGERDQPITELVCQACGDSYMHRPSLKATMVPIGLPTGRKRNKLFVWEGVLTDYSSGMAVVLAPSLEAAYAILRSKVSEYGMSEIMSTEPEIIESLTCVPQEWHVTGGG